MKVLLKRGLVLNAIHYDVNAKGTEVPSQIEGKTVVSKEDWKKLPDAEREKAIPLPQDAKILDATDDLSPPPAPPAGQALSSMAKASEPKNPDAKTLSELNKTKK